MRYILLCIIIAIIIMSAVHSGVCVVMEGVRVNNGTSLCVNCTNGTSWNVTNSNARAIFVPNATQAEFDAFRYNAPGVTVVPCGGCDGVMNITVTHTAGAVAPVSKTVTYGLVQTSLSGASKCWITQNLGATNQATSATDATEASAGWYWQFNRKQGWKYDTSLVPTSPAWDNTNDNTYTGWDPAKDPCTILLGAGWRIPTYTEWFNADGAPQNWASSTATFNSVLKLHMAGCLSFGALSLRGSSGYYWGRTQYSGTIGWYLYFNSGNSGMYNLNKAYGFSLRCLKD